MVSGSSCAGGWLGLGDTTGFVLPHGRSFRVNHSKTVCLPDYPAGWGAARGRGEGALVSQRICLCDVLIESDRLWTSWTPAGLTSEAFSAASSLCHGWWEEDGNSSRRKVTQHLKRPFHVLPTTSCRTAHSQGRRSFLLYSLPEVSQKTFFVSLSTVSCALGTITAAAPPHPPASARAPSHGTGGLRVR